MTKLEKRQMKLLVFYLKHGIYRFVVVVGTLCGVFFTVLDLMNEDPFF